MSELCLEYGISRKTGYKFKERFEQGGRAALFDLPRTPRHSPARTPEPIRELLIELRLRHPTWGAKKLVSYLTTQHPGISLPAPSTVGEMLARRGLVRPRRRRPQFVASASALTDAKRPNDVWCADYKGQFRLGNGRYCYPLTITDQASRFIIGCEGFAEIDGATARAVFEDRFSRYGLPRVIRTDNGAPFASCGLFGLSRLSVFWLKLGIVPERIEPGEPQQNGRHERMHRTLKQETTRPAAGNLLQQQERFDRFVSTFNDQRPHEALGQVPPATVFTPSERRHGQGGELDYPLHDDVQTVAVSGHMHVPGKRRSFFLSTALAGERVGIRELPDGQWLVSFAALDLGWIDPTSATFRPADREDVTP
jgi:transposase InsO family protein